MDLYGIISLIVCSIAVLLGYLYPRLVSYFVLITTPILSPARLIIIPSSTLPLEYIIFVFSLSLGVSLTSSFRNNVHKSIKLNKFYIIILTFLIIIQLLTSRYEDLSTTLFLDFTTYFVGVIIPIYVVRSYNELEKIIKILVLQGGLVGILIILSYLEIFDFTKMIRTTLDSYDLERLNDVQRNNMKRVHGLDGSASQTASRLSFLLFLSLWLTITKNSIVYKINIILIVIGIILLQTRASYVAIIIGFFSLSILLAKRRQIDVKQILNASIIVIIIITILTIVPFAKNTMISFNEYFINSLSTDDKSVEVKVDRIPVALNYASEKFISGYGSREYVYYKIMKTDDIPTPLIYLLSGGIVLMLLNVMSYIIPIFKIWYLSKRRIFDGNEKKLLIFSTVAIMAGYIMTLSNWLETHRMIMIVLFVSIVKYTAIKIKKNDYK